MVWLCLPLFLDGLGLLRAQMCHGGDSLLGCCYSTFHLVPEAGLWAVGYATLQYDPVAHASHLTELKHRK